MENYLIYRILNLKTRKFYIGRTTTSIKNRWSVHLAHAKYGDKYSKTADKRVGQTHLYRAMRKYGIENFEIKQIDEAKSYDHMVFLENFYIKYFNSLDPKYGYNLVTDEYDSGDRRIISKETSDRMSLSTHYKYNKPSGVSYDKIKKGYTLRMNFLKKEIVCKRFKDENLAKIAHDKVEILFYKDNPLLYFPYKKEEFLKEDLQDFYNKLITKRPRNSEFDGISKCKTGYNIRINTESKKRLFIGYHKEEKEAAIIWDKVAYYLGYNKEELNLPELWNENYYTEGEKIFITYSNPRKQNQRKKPKTSKYNGVNKRSTYSWEMLLTINGERIRENYREEVDAAKAFDFYIRQRGLSENRLNFPDLIILEKPQEFKPNSKESYVKLKGMRNSRTTEFKSVKIKCINTGIIYESLSDAAKQTNEGKWKFNQIKNNPNFEIAGSKWEIIKE